MGCMRLGNDFAILALVPETLDKLQAGVHVVRCYVEHLLECRIHRIGRHLLQTHIGSPQLGYLR